ncbi:MAG: DUF2066 domain-containing protein [Rhodomicrobiaceae bacterium]
MMIRIAFIAFLAMLLALCPTAKAKTSGVYTVAKVSVSADADNAVAAKEKALAQAQQIALRALLTRMTPWSAHGRLPVLNSDMIERMIEGFVVRRESNSNTRYIATLDFSFEPNAVRDILNRFELPYTDQQAPQSLLLPVMVEGGAVRPGSKNPWFEALSGVDGEHTLAPIKLASPRSDLSASMIGDLSASSHSLLETLGYQYRSQNVVLAIADVDAQATALHLRLIGQDAVGNFALDRTFRIPERDIDYTANLAAQISVKVIEGRWRRVKLTSQGAYEGPADLQRVALTAQFSSLKAWQDMRARLQKVPGLQGLDVKALNARGASIEVDFPGGAERLAQAAQSQGLALERRGQDWLLFAR